MKVFVIENNYGDEASENNLQIGSGLQAEGQSGHNPGTYTESGSGNGTSLSSGSTLRDTGTSGTGSLSELTLNETGWYLIADSAVSNTGKPFYLPEGRGRVTVALGPALRVSRLGKSIAGKFAHRYYSEFAPAVHFRLPDYRAALQKAGRSADASVNFDRSLFVGEFHPASELKELLLFRNGEKVSEWRDGPLKKNPEEVLSEISLMNTLKMGDLVLPGITEGVEIKEGDRLDVWVNGVLSFQVKMK